MLKLLQVLFVALKLTGHIDWSWWVVLWPMYLWVALVALREIIREIEERR